MAKMEVSMKKTNLKRKIATLLSATILGMAVLPYLPLDILTTWGFHLNFEATGDPAHPNLKGIYGGYPSYFFV